MQVKRFEAKSMKEALQMVKQELGPEAIILSAKDNKKSFGLAGGGSIEVTAAISEKSLVKKQYVENRIPEKDKARFRTQSAKDQRSFIENTIAKRQRVNIDPRLGKAAISQTSRPPTSRRYIDIADEEEALALNGRRVDDVLSEVLKAASKMPQSGMIEENQVYSRPPVKTGDEVLFLRREVDSLKEMLKTFQTSGRSSMTQHPGAEYSLPFELSGIFEKLQSAGIEIKYIVEILEKANSELTTIEKKRKTLVDAWVARHMMNNINVAPGWLQNENSRSVHLFFGPSGQGKTSVLIKMAAQLSLNEKKRVAVLTCDTFKVGAPDQLKIYCQILNLPFEVIRHGVELASSLKRYEGYDAVLVDYPGLGLKDIKEIDQLRSLMPPMEIAAQSHLVLSCTVKDADAYEACHRYEFTQFQDLIMTKIDESSIHGLLYNIQKKTEKPLYAFGVGPKIPEDIELASRERVLDLIYKITKR